MIKRILTALLAVSLALTGFTGCGERERDDTLKIVCTVFPVYEWARNIVGDAENVELIWLVQNGTDSHSYQPTTADIVHMISCDLLLYVGSDPETWVEACLENRRSDDRMVVDLSKAEGVTLREISAESVLHEEHDHDHDHDHDHGATDEHLWLSLRNAMACGTEIADLLCTLDPDGAERYRANWASYQQQLRDLDEAYVQAVAEARTPSVLVADRFPFVYLTEDYGIRYVAAFEGCTTEAEATPDTVIHLADHVDEWGLTFIVVTEGSDRSLAEGVRRATKTKNQEIAVLHSLQSVSRRQAEEGATYLGIMEENLRTLCRVMDSPWEKG